MLFRHADETPWSIPQALRRVVRPAVDSLSPDSRLCVCPACRLWLKAAEVATMFLRTVLIFSALGPTHPYLLAAVDNAHQMFEWRSRLSRLCPTPKENSHSSSQTSRVQILCPCASVAPSVDPRPVSDILHDFLIAAPVQFEPVPTSASTAGAIHEHTSQWEKFNARHNAALNLDGIVQAVLRLQAWPVLMSLISHGLVPVDFYCEIPTAIHSAMSLTATAYFSSQMSATSSQASSRSLSRSGSSSNLLHDATLSASDLNQVTVAQ
jgi:hypothetical protein